MRLYETARGHFAGTQKLADTVAERDGSGKGNWQCIDVPTDKPGLINWLNDRQLEAPHTNSPRPIGTSSAKVEPMTEDVFETLPLAMQLHLAALALENARDRVKG